MLCPRGTFNPNINQANISGCEPCSAGQFCGDEGLSAPSGMGSIILFHITYF